MRESVIYQEIEAAGILKGRQEGLQLGRQEGLQAEAKSLVLRQLGHKFGVLSSEIQVKIENLSLTQLESLGEALLDFSELQDLVAWLQQIA